MNSVFLRNSHKLKASLVDPYPKLQLLTDNVRTFFTSREIENETCHNRFVTRKVLSRLSLKIKRNFAQKTKSRKVGDRVLAEENTAKKNEIQEPESITPIVEKKKRCSCTKLNARLNRFMEEFQKENLAQLHNNKLKNDDKQRGWKTSSNVNNRKDDENNQKRHLSSRVPPYMTITRSQNLIFSKLFNAHSRFYSKQYSKEPSFRGPTQSNVPLGFIDFEKCKSAPTLVSNKSADVVIKNHCASVGTLPNFSTQTKPGSTSKSTKSGKPSRRKACCGEDFQAKFPPRAKEIIIRKPQQYPKSKWRPIKIKILKCRCLTKIPTTEKAKVTKEKKEAKGFRGMFNNVFKMFGNSKRDVHSGKSNFHTNNTIGITRMRLAPGSKNRFLFSYEKLPKKKICCKLRNKYPLNRFSGSSPRLLTKEINNLKIIKRPHSTFENRPFSLPSHTGQNIRRNSAFGNTIDIGDNELTETENKFEDEISAPSPVLAGELEKLPMELKKSDDECKVEECPKPGRPCEVKKKQIKINECDCHKKKPLMKFPCRSKAPCEKAEEITDPCKQPKKEVKESPCKTAKPKPQPPVFDPCAKPKQEKSEPKCPCQEEEQKCDTKKFHSVLLDESDEFETVLVAESYEFQPILVAENYIEGKDFLLRMSEDDDSPCRKKYPSPFAVCVPEKKKPCQKKEPEKPKKEACGDKKEAAPKKEPCEKKKEPEKSKKEACADKKEAAPKKDPCERKKEPEKPKKDPCGDKKEKKKCYQPKKNEECEKKLFGDKNKKTDKPPPPCKLEKFAKTNQDELTTPLMDLSHYKIEKLEDLFTKEHIDLESKHSSQEIDEYHLPEVQNLAPEISSTNFAPEMNYEYYLSKLLHKHENTLKMKSESNLLESKYEEYLKNIINNTVVETSYEDYLSQILNRKREIPKKIERKPPLPKKEPVKTQISYEDFLSKILNDGQKTPMTKAAKLSSEVYNEQMLTKNLGQQEQKLLKIQPESKPTSEISYEESLSNILNKPPQKFTKNSEESSSQSELAYEKYLSNILNPLHQPQSKKTKDFKSMSEVSCDDYLTSRLSKEVRDANNALSGDMAAEDDYHQCLAKLLSKNYELPKHLTGNKNKANVDPKIFKNNILDEEMEDYQKEINKNASKQNEIFARTKSIKNVTIQDNGIVKDFDCSSTTSRTKKSVKSADPCVGKASNIIVQDNGIIEEKTIFDKHSGDPRNKGFVLVKEGDAKSANLSTVPTSKDSKHSKEKHTRNLTNKITDEFKSTKSVLDFVLTTKTSKVKNNAEQSKGAKKFILINTITSNDASNKSKMAHSKSNINNNDNTNATVKSNKIKKSFLQLKTTDNTPNTILFINDNNKSLKNMETLKKHEKPFEETKDVLNKEITEAVTSLKPKSALNEHVTDTIISKEDTTIKNVPPQGATATEDTTVNNQNIIDSTIVMHSFTNYFNENKSPIIKPQEEVNVTIKDNTTDSNAQDSAVINSFGNYFKDTENSTIKSSQSTDNSKDNNDNSIDDDIVVNQRELTTLIIRDNLKTGCELSEENNSVFNEPLVIANNNNSIKDSAIVTATDSTDQPTAPAIGNTEPTAIAKDTDSSEIINSFTDYFKKSTKNINNCNVDQEVKDPNTAAGLINTVSLGEKCDTPLMVANNNKTTTIIAPTATQNNLDEPAVSVSTPTEVDETKPTTSTAADNKITFQTTDKPAENVLEKEVEYNFVVDESIKDKIKIGEIEDDKKVDVTIPKTGVKRLFKKPKTNVEEFRKLVATPTSKGNMSAKGISGETVKSIKSVNTNGLTIRDILKMADAKGSKLIYNDNGPITRKVKLAEVKLADPEDHKSTKKGDKTETLTELPPTVQKVIEVATNLAKKSLEEKMRTVVVSQLPVEVKKLALTCAVEESVKELTDAVAQEVLKNKKLVTDPSVLISDTAIIKDNFEFTDRMAVLKEETILDEDTEDVGLLKASFPISNESAIEEIMSLRFDSRFPLAAERYEDEDMPKDIAKDEDELMIKIEPALENRIQVMDENILKDKEEDELLNKKETTLNLDNKNQMVDEDLSKYEDEDELTNKKQNILGNGNQLINENMSKYEEEEEEDEIPNKKQTILKLIEKNEVIDEIMSKDKEEDELANKRQTTLKLGNKNHVIDEEYEDEDELTNKKQNILKLAYINQMGHTKIEDDDISKEDEDEDELSRKSNNVLKDKSVVIKCNDNIKHIEAFSARNLEEDILDATSATNENLKDIPIDANPFNYIEPMKEIEELEAAMPENEEIQAVNHNENVKVAEELKSVQGFLKNQFDGSTTLPLDNKEIVSLLSQYLQEDIVHVKIKNSMTESKSYQDEPEFTYEPPKRGVGHQFKVASRAQTTDDAIKRLDFKDLIRKNANKQQQRNKTIQENQSIAPSSKSSGNDVDES